MESSRRLTESLLREQDTVFFGIDLIIPVVWIRSQFGAVSRVEEQKTSAVREDLIIDAADIFARDDVSDTKGLLITCERRDDGSTKLIQV